MQNCGSKIFALRRHLNQLIYVHHIYLLSPHRSRQVYRIEHLHPPARPVTAELLKVTVKKGTVYNE
jgi:hypothetical protein